MNWNPILDFLNGDTPRISIMIISYDFDAKKGKQSIHVNLSTSPSEHRDKKIIVQNLAEGHELVGKNNM